MKLTVLVGIHIHFNFSGFDEHMQQKFNEMVPPITEMERILAKRKSPKEREKVVKFYSELLQNIADEIDGVCGNNSIVIHLYFTFLY